MGRSISNLFNNLPKAILRIKCKFGHDDKKFETCGIKYKYRDCFLKYKCLCCNKKFQHKFYEKLK